MTKTFTIALAALALGAVPATAQDGGESREPLRIRAGIGPQLVPSYPGSKDVNIRPLWDLSIARGDEPFEFEAADESFGIPFRIGDLQVGPALNVEGARRVKETGPGIEEVGTSIELGGFAQVSFSPNFRVRTEVRKAVNGHRGWVGSAGFDWVSRDKDAYLFSIGPRVGFSDRTYQDAYFGVSPASSALTGLPVHRPRSAIHSVGALAGFIYQLDDRWGLYSYAKYDRLIGDAGDSPVIRSRGTPDQLSGGLALTYTFGRRGAVR
jgi:outer membrane protein